MDTLKVNNTQGDENEQNEDSSLNTTTTQLRDSTREEMSKGVGSSGNDNFNNDSLKYFTLCALGGFLSCGITHTLVTPLDLAKCRMQVILDFWILFFFKNLHLIRFRF